MEKTNIDGIILVTSCQKYKNTRLQEFKVPRDEYIFDYDTENTRIWRTFYVIGDIFLDKPYILEGNLLTIKCEDSYLHLYKKTVLALKYLFELYNVRVGVIRVGDDLFYNEQLLVDFINNLQDGDDYIGSVTCNDQELIKKLTCNNQIDYENHKDLLKNNIYDTFMFDYYKDHPEDFENIYHGIKNIDISICKYRPHIACALGPFLYFSAKSSNILIETLHKINYNVFIYDDYCNAHPYLFEDVGIGYSFFTNGIKLTINNNVFCDGTNYRQPEKFITYHTNKYKEV